MLPETIGQLCKSREKRTAGPAAHLRGVPYVVGCVLDITAGCPCSAGIEGRNRDVPSAERGATADASG